MIKKENKIITLILFIILSSSFGIASFSLNNSNFYISNFSGHDKYDIPKISQSALGHGAIEQNASKIYRLFESINISIDTSKFDYTNYTKMHIFLSDNSTEVYDMHFDGNKIFYYVYKPEYNAPLGFYNVSFSIYNNTHDLLNTQTTYTNFTVLTNYMINFDQSEYYISDLLNADLIVTNFSTHDFSWNISVVDSLDSGNQYMLKSLGKNLVHLNFPIENETFIEKDQFYYIQLNMTDKGTGRQKTAYFPFFVRNNDPTISSEIRFSNEEVLRTEDCTISFNATDIETPTKKLSSIMNVYDPQGNFLFQHNIDFESDNLFSHTFSISANRPIGKYKIEVSVADGNGGANQKEAFLTVNNNLPEIHGYTINGNPMDQSTSVPYGRNLVFTFNVSDIEGISYVKVALLDENNEWFNITHAYVGENTEITIRTVDLLSGVWFVYIYVTDSDGAITSLIDDYDMAPQGITIIPDILSTYLPWILLFTGIGIGMLIGIVAIYSYMKTKYVDSQKITQKRKDIQTKKLSVKKGKRTKLIEKEIDEKETDQLKDEEEEEKEGAPKRKIKRQL